MQYTKQDLDDFQVLLTETAKKILKDPRAKALVEKFGVCSIYLDDTITGVGISIKKPNK